MIKLSMKQAMRSRGVGRRFLHLMIVALVLTLVPLFRADGVNTVINEAHSEAEREPVKVIETVVNAWNRSDADTLAHQFLQDGFVVLPRGGRIQSRADIKNRVIKERNGRLQDTRLAKVVDHVSFPDRNKAVVTGRYQLEGMTILRIFEVTPSGKFVLEQIKAEGRWLIAKAELHSN